MPAAELPSCQEEQSQEMLRKRIQDHHTAMGLQTKERFHDVLAELFFLQHGGNMMDFLVWKKKPPLSYYEYVRTQPLEAITPVVEVASQSKPATIPGIH